MISKAQIRKAHVNEVPEIYRLLVNFSKKAEWDILPRKMADLYNLVRDFFVYRQDQGRIRGLAALHIFWEDLGEICSLGVLPDLRKQGIGSLLVEKCLEEARDLGLKRVFVLTSTQNASFFERFGFKEVDKDDLPRIIWRDCGDCLKFPDCDEIPMLLELATRK
jgi:amino-acid N-acetyltransferase